MLEEKVYTLDLENIYARYGIFKSHVKGNSTVIRQTDSEHFHVEETSGSYVILHNLN